MSKLKNDYVYSAIMRIAMVAIAFGESVVIARFLSQAVKGQVDYINSVTSVTTIIFAFGIHQAYPYYKRQSGETFKNDFLNASFFLGMVYLILAVISMFFIKSEVIRIIVFLVPIEVLAKFFSYVALIEKPILRNRSELWINLLDLGIVVTCYFLAKPSLFLGVLTLIVKNVLMFFIYAFRMEFRVKINKGTFSMLKKLLVFGFLPMLSLLLTNLNYRADVIMMKDIVTDEQIAIYSVGVAFAEKCWLITDTLRDIMTSKLAKGKGTEEVSKIIRFSSTITVAIAIVIALLGRVVIVMLYGQDYAPSYGVTLLIMIGSFGMVFTKLVAAYNVVVGKQKINMVLMAVGVGINIVLNWILIGPYGMYGAAIASICSYTLMGMSYAIYFIVTYKIKLSDILFLRRKDINSFFKKGAVK